MTAPRMPGPDAEAVPNPIARESTDRRGVLLSHRFIVLLVCALLGAAAIGVFAFKLNLRGSKAERGTEALVQAFSHRRPIEGRLSGGFKAGEFDPSRDYESDIETSAFEHGRELLEDAAATQQPAALLAYGRFLLLDGKPEEAMRQLKAAAGNLPQSAEAHNDLGVCLLVQRRLEDALEQFDEALSCNDRMAEALFNRALCYERLLLRQDAAEEYARLAKTERDQMWRKEVDARLEAMTRPLAPAKRQADIVNAFEAALATGNETEARRIIAQNVEVIAKLGKEGLRARYLTAAVAGDESEAQRLLEEIRFIGTALLEFKGDSVVADTAAHLASLSEDGRRKELALVRDYLDVSSGISTSNNYADAVVRFERLAKAFEQANDRVFTYSSTFQIAACLYAENDLLSSAQLLVGKVAQLESQSWPMSRANRLTQLGLTSSRLGRVSFAIQCFDSALAYAEDLRFLRAKTLQLASNAYSDIGEIDKASNLLRQSTSLLLSNIPSLKDVANNYTNLADLHRLQGQHKLAILYARQARLIAEEAGDYNRVAQALSFLGLEEARVGRFAEAERDLAAAMETLKRVDAGQRIYTGGLVFARAGQVATLRRDLSGAVDLFTKGLKSAEKLKGSPLPLVRVFHGRAQAYIQAGDNDSAAADLMRAMGIVLNYRAGLGESEMRRAFLDVRQEVFDDAILLQLDGFHDEEKAFDFSEQSRARGLLDQFSLSTAAEQPKGKVSREGGDLTARASNTAPLSLTQARAALPDDLRLVVYSVTDQRTYIFLVTKSQFKVVQSPATSSSLEASVHDYVSSLKNKGPIGEVSDQARSLYRDLIKPAEADLADGKAICIIPDKSLHFLPFAALIDDSGHYLIQSHTIGYAPSASILVRCIEEAKRKAASQDERILAVGNPLFDPPSFPELALVPDSEREATQSASVYTKRRVLVGTQATEAAVRQALKDCDVAHLALHCLVDEQSPWLAALVLAGAHSPGLDTSTPDDGLLFLKEINSLHLPRTNLVVLSACQSGLGQYFRGEGIVSLAYPFLASGVPTVVASLWPIDSRATSQLMIEFHRARKAAQPGNGHALRAAQLKMIESESTSHPYYWAAFIVMGRE